MKRLKIRTNLESLTVRTMPHKQRAWALFFLFGFLAGILTPSASVYAAQHRPDLSNSHIKKDDAAARNKPMRQNYVGGMQSIESDKKAATDARPITDGSMSGSTDKVGNPGEVLRGIDEKPKITPHELVDKRTATSSVSVNQDGTLTEKQFFEPKHFKKDGKWEVIDTGLQEDKNAGDAGSIMGRAWGDVLSWFSDETTFKVKANEWQARFAAGDAKQGLLRIGKGSEQVSFIAVGAKKGVKPVITTNSDGTQIVHYYDLWPDVNVEYVVESVAVKENIILKNKNAANQISFKVEGAGLEERIEKQKIGDQEVTTKAHVLKGVMNDEFAIAPANLILNNYGFVSDQSAFKQDVQGDTITLSVERGYLQSLPDNAFPAVIDPSTFYGTFGTRSGGTYVSFKTDGTVCASNVCNPYAGSLYDSGNVLRYWRGAVYAPYSQLNDTTKSLSNATLYLKQRSNESFWTGTFDAHTYYAGHAACLNSFNCLAGGVFNASGVVSSSGSINVTGIYQSAISQGDFGAWLMLGGEDGTTSSFKNFDPGTGAYNSGSYVAFTYNGSPAAPNMESPVADQVYVDPQPSFSVSYATNPNGSTPLQYQMRVSNGPNGAGFLTASPMLTSTQWTMPDNVLQDGSTYYIQARSYDPISSLYSNWGSSVAFRIDMRTGTDKTQTYDTLGPVNVNLATGNLSTSIASHSSVAQGGALGIGLNYNTPLKSRSGLVGEYWNVATGYTGGTPVTTPNLTRVDQRVDFDWDTGSPSGGTINNDWFYARWTGYFVTPKTGTYQFGARNDDALVVKVNNQQMYNNGGCYNAACYDNTSITLQEGQVVPITIEYQDATSLAYVQLYVKGAVGERVLPTDWLQTGVRPVNAKKNGLKASYFARLDGTNTFSANNYKIMERADAAPNFNWGTAAPVPNGPTDFLVRWSGYVTAPESGDYTFGSRSDDGTKIMVGASDTVVLNDWASHGAPATPTWGGTSFTLAANTPTKITIEYYDEGGPASVEMWIKRAGVSTSEQIIPSSWFTVQAGTLPDGWDLGVDGSGTAQYGYLKAGQNSAILSDSSGSTHEYAWTGTGYKPPVNENGYLVRNTDGTHTLQDSDGQVYVFGVDGTLTSVTSSPDDRSPAALKYEYQSLNNGPTHLYRISDGVDTSRTMTLYYSGQGQCGSVPATFDANAPANMLCAAQTNDGRTTYFYYVQGQLARVATPGNSLVDYQYETVSAAGGAVIGYRLVAIRDALANDAIAAGIRANDNNVKTQITYDALGRVTGVTQPAPTSGAARIQHMIEYLPGAKPYVDENGSFVPGYAGMTKQHITGATEPQGYARRIKYDDLFRTIESTDITGLSTVSEWDTKKDMVYSVTDPTGMRSTTIYDDQDRPVKSYGPAPKAWFTSGTPNNQVPQAAYDSQIPHTDAGYDEGIVGPAVAWYDYTRQAGTTAGVLSGAPRLHTTGLTTATPGVMSMNLTAPPITPDGTKAGYGFSATGKLRLPNGTYWINADTSEGIRVWIDDQLVIDQWQDAAYRSVTGGSFTVANTAVKRLRIDTYRKNGSTGAFNVWMKQDFGFDWTTNWTNYLKPDYSLPTSTKSYDSTIGDSTATVGYGNTPELGLPRSVTSDPTGLNLTSTGNYEQQGAAGSYLRPTSSSRPGDTTNNPAASYAYYGATETRDNPCTATTESYKQAGLAKIITNASPDGGATAGRKTETVYDDAGRIVAVRTNSDGWVCTTYDTRGRVIQTVIPAIGSEAGRTITNNHAVYADPTKTSVEDSSGANITQVDLLGRTIYYRDTLGDETWTNYDNLGRVASRSSDVGQEAFIYDSYSRLVQQKLDTVAYAVITYDQYGRTQSVDYPSAYGQKMVVSRDSLGRVIGQTYYAGGSQTPGSNLVTNSSIEQSSGSPAAPVGWHGDSWGTNTPTFTYLNEGYTGTHSVKTELTSRTDGDAKWYFDPVNVSPNTMYAFKDYYKSNIPTEAVVQYTHQDQSVTYEWLGTINASSTWTQLSLNFTAPATATKATVLHIVAAVGWLMVDDAELSAVANPGSQTVIASDAVTRSQTGRIVSGTENGQNKSYTYDKAGRLTNATIGTNTYSYGYGTQSATCAAGTNANAGKNFNRTSQTINGVATNYCYDYADRLVSSSDPLANNAQYDSHGNLTQLGSGTTPLRMYYDSSDRNWGFEQYTSSGTGNAVYYGRDAQGRVRYHETDNISNWNWTTTDGKWYGYSGNGSGPSIVRDANWTVVEKYLSLPGGVLMTVRPTQTGNNQKVYSLPNLHGSIMATTNASGVLISTFSYDPFGNKLSTTLPNNTFASATLGWAGSLEKATETSLALTPTQMGARVYLPSIGRFAQVDPVPGGNANDYVYAVDPVNFNDFTGKCLQCAAGASYLQPAATTVRVQAAAPAPYYQPAIGTRAVQTVAKVNLAIIRSPAPARNDSGRLPVATVNAIGYLTDAKKASDAQLNASGGASEGYTKFSLGGSFIVGAGGGIVITDQGKLHWFGYYSVGIKPGIDASLMSSTTPVSCGWSTNASYSYLIGQSVSQDGSVEVGLATPGISTDRTYVGC